jgi:hypothetical protein
MASRCCAINNKHRVNQVMGGERIFTNEVAGKRVAPQAAWATKGVGSVRCHGEKCKRGMVFVTLREKNFRAQA